MEIDLLKSNDHTGSTLLDLKSSKNQVIFKLLILSFTFFSIHVVMLPYQNLFRWPYLFSILSIDLFTVSIFLVCISTPIFHLFQRFVNRLFSYLYVISKAVETTNDFFKACTTNFQFIYRLLSTDISLIPITV